MCVLPGGALFPHCQPMIEAALRSGAHGAFLSGAGPTVVAITGGVGVAVVQTRRRLWGAAGALLKLACHGPLATPEDEAPRFLGAMRVHAAPPLIMGKRRLPFGHTGIATAGSDTMGEFVAEAVSHALLEAADQHGVRGSVHIAEPSAAGLRSVCYDDSGSVM